MPKLIPSKLFPSAAESSIAPHTEKLWSMTSNSRGEQSNLKHLCLTWQPLFTQMHILIKLTASHLKMSSHFHNLQVCKDGTIHGSMSCSKNSTFHSPRINSLLLSNDTVKEHPYVPVLGIPANRKYPS